MSKLKNLTDFLGELPVDAGNYCSYIEDTAYHRMLHILEMQTAGITYEQMEEKCSEYRLNLPNKIRTDYPKLSAMQIEGTCQLILDSIESDIYLDCLFASLNNLTARKQGRKLFTHTLNLQVLGVQYN